MIRLHPELEIASLDIGALDRHPQSRLLPMRRNQDNRRLVFGRNICNANRLIPPRIAGQIAPRQRRRLIQEESSLVDLAKAYGCSRHTGGKHIVCGDATRYEAVRREHPDASQQARHSSFSFHCGKNSRSTSILPPYAFGIAHNFPFSLDMTIRSASDEAEYTMKNRAAGGTGK